MARKKRLKRLVEIENPVLINEEDRPTMEYLSWFIKKHPDYIHKNLIELYIASSLRNIAGNNTEIVERNLRELYPADYLEIKELLHTKEEEFPPEYLIYRESSSKKNRRRKGINTKENNG